MNEVWSKVLFLSGRDGIAEAAALRELPGLWVADDGAVAMSSQMAQFVIWQRPA
jgi:hypothetical protein